MFPPFIWENTFNQVSRVGLHGNIPIVTLNFNLWQALQSRFNIHIDGWKVSVVYICLVREDQTRLQDFWKPMKPVGNTHCSFILWRISLFTDVILAFLMSYILHVKPQGIINVRVLHSEKDCANVFYLLPWRWEDFFSA